MKRILPTYKGKKICKNSNGYVSKRYAMPNLVISENILLDFVGLTKDEYKLKHGRVCKIDKRYKMGMQWIFTPEDNVYRPKSGDYISASDLSSDIIERIKEIDPLEVSWFQGKEYKEKFIKFQEETGLYPSILCSSIIFDRDIVNKFKNEAIEWIEIEEV